MAVIGILLLGSCTKQVQPNSPAADAQTQTDALFPGPGIPFHFPVDPGLTPMKDYMATQDFNTHDTEFVQQSVTNVGGDPDEEGAELGYAFRSSEPGVINFVGIWLPTAGFFHNVTIWDSVTQRVLLQQLVINSSDSGYTYVDLRRTNKQVFIAANRPYVVAVNSVSLGQPIQVFNANNYVWRLNIEDFNMDQHVGHLFPFQDGPIFMENSCFSRYGTTYMANAPMPVAFDIVDRFNFYGFVDIGFTAGRFLRPAPLPVFPFR